MCATALNDTQVSTMEAATSTGALGEAMTPEMAAEVETVEQVCHSSFGSASFVELIASRTQRKEIASTTAGRP